MFDMGINYLDQCIYRNYHTPTRILIKCVNADFRKILLETLNVWCKLLTNQSSMEHHLTQYLLYSLSSAQLTESLTACVFICYKDVI